MNAEHVLTGSAATPGIAIGPALLYHLRPGKSAGGRSRQSAPGDASATATILPQAELERLDKAIATADTAMAAAETRLRELDRLAAAQIFSAHRMLLRSPALREHTQTLIVEMGYRAAEAIVEAGEDQAEQLSGLIAPYVSMFVADIRGVVEQVQRILIGESSLENQLTQPSIVIAQDLGPFELMHIPQDRLLGLALIGGGPTGHSTILTRALGVPTVIGLGPAALDYLADGVIVALDGDAGRIVISPTEETLVQMRASAATQAERQAELRDQGNLACVTSDGQRVTLLANVASSTEARIAREYGAEGIGSLRTELLFLERPTLPDEEEQVALYSAVAAELPGLPIVIRTLDLGGDKQLPSFPLPKEDNPFLGWRGIRIGLSHPEDLLLPQLRAMLRTGATANIRIVVPMISSLAEFRRVRAFLEQAHSQLLVAGIPCAPRLQLGVLIEVPAAAIIADALAQEADFISIGTNDLVQYALACDRTSQRVANLYQPLAPAILRLIAMITDAAHRHGRLVSICGEMAGDPSLTALLIGLGIDELSCAPAALPRLRAAVRATDAAAARQQARAALTAGSLDEVRVVLRTDGPQ